MSNLPLYYSMVQWTKFPFDSDHVQTILRSISLPNAIGIIAAAENVEGENLTGSRIHEARTGASSISAQMFQYNKCLSITAEASFALLARPTSNL